MLEKLKEVILHISEVCKDEPEYGATKLNKILFVIDFYAFSILEKPITEAKYFHLVNGPAPKEMLQAQDELIVEGKAEIQKEEYFGRTQKRLVPIEGPDLSIFSKEEREIMKEVIDSTRGFNARKLSDWTHELSPWILTEDKEDIPFFTVFTMFKRPVGRDGIAWGEKELNRLRELGNVT